MLVMPEPQFLFCDRCLRRFKKRWPRGVALATIAMLDAFLADRRSDILTSNEVTSIGPAMKRVAPVCRWLKDHSLVETIITEALDGKCHGRPIPPKPDPLTPDPGDIGQN